MYALTSGVTGLPGVPRVPIGPYERFAAERRVPSRGVDRLTEVVPDDTEMLPKSPGVEYMSLNNNMFKS
jgi:hypothetical protein